MKTVGKLLVLLFGLSVLMLGAPLENRFARTRRERRPSDPTPAGGSISPTRTPTPRRSLAPLAILAGGETCATATPIVLTAGHYDDSGDTGSAADDNSITGCPGINMPGPDLVYKFTVFPGNNLTFTLSPELNGQYDPGIYILPETTPGSCAAVGGCVAKSDTALNGQPETITVSGLLAGKTYYFFVDSVWFHDKLPQAAGGPYTLSVIGTLGDPSITPSPTPTATPTATRTFTPTPTPTNTRTSHPDEHEDVHSDIHTDTDFHRDADLHAHEHADDHAHENFHADEHRDEHGDEDLHADQHTDQHADRYLHADEHADAHPDQHGDSDPVEHSNWRPAQHPDRDTDEYTHPD